MMDLIDLHMHLVDHILDQEQPPTAWRLQTSQLRFQVWGVWLRDRATAARSRPGRFCSSPFHTF